MAKLTKNEYIDNLDGTWTLRVTGKNYVDDVTIDDDFKIRAEKYRWHIAPGVNRYCRTTIPAKEKRKIIGMHKMVIDDYFGCMVDHINNNTLDNRRSNLRFVDGYTNSGNQKAKGYYIKNGVIYSKTSLNGKQIHLGKFDTIEEAQAAFREFKFKNNIWLVDLIKPCPEAEG